MEHPRVIPCNLSPKKVPLLGSLREHRQLAKWTRHNSRQLPAMPSSRGLMEHISDGHLHQLQLFQRF